MSQLSRAISLITLSVLLYQMSAALLPPREMVILQMLARLDCFQFLILKYFHTAEHFIILYWPWVHDILDMSN